MKADKALIRHALAILARIGPAGIEENALMIEIEIAAGRPLTTAEARDTLVFCADRGWIASRCDEFEQTRTWITHAGINTLAGM